MEAAGATDAPPEVKRKRAASPSSDSSSSGSSDARAKKRKKEKRRKEKKHKKERRKREKHKKEKHKKEKHKKEKHKKHKKERRSDPVQLSKFLEHAGDSSGDSGSEEARYSVITGKRINLDRKKTGTDRESDKQRKLYLKWLNAGYD